MAQADRGERGAVRDPEHRDGAGGEVPLLRGLGGELQDQDTGKPTWRSSRGRAR